jgi:hypothetical protein
MQRVTGIDPSGTAKEKMVADVLTKPLPVPKFRQFVANMHLLKRQLGTFLSKSSTSWGE